MSRRLLLLRLQPCCEIVERDVQCRADFGERGEAAGLASRLDLAQVVRRYSGGGGERLAGEAMMGAPNADRVLAIYEFADEFC